MADQPKALINQAALESAVQVDIAPGASIADVVIAADIPDAVLPSIVTVLNGIEVEEHERDNVYLEDDDRLAVFVLPAGGGGKDVLRMVAVIAVAAAASYAVGPSGLKLGTALEGGGFALSTAGHVVQAGLTLVGTMAVNALIPPAQPRLTGGGGEGSDPTFWFSGSSNQMKPYQRVPIVYGDVRMYAAAIASPVIFNAGTQSEFTGLYDFGLGNVNVFDIKIGDTSIGVLGGKHLKLEQEPKLINTANPSQGYKPVPLTLMRVPTASTPLTYGLNDKNDNGIATTRPDTTAARVEVVFPSGLVEFKDNGDEQGRSVQYKIEIKKNSEPASAWRFPRNVTAYVGDHFTVDGVNTGDPSAPANYPTGRIIVDPDSTATRDASGNIVLGVGDRVTVRFEFDQAVFSFQPTDALMAPFPITPYLLFDKTPVNPNGYPVVGVGDPSEGVMIVDGATNATGMTIFELEYTAVSGQQKTGIQFSLDTSSLLDARPSDGGQAFDSYLITASETLTVNAVATPVPPPPDGSTPQPDDTEYYEQGVTYLYYIGIEIIAGSTVAIEAGSEKLVVKGTQRAISLSDAYLARGTIVKKQAMLGFGGSSDRSEYWCAVKKEFI